MEVFQPTSVRQAKWLIAGGLLIVVMGVMRAVTFFRGGGLMFLIMGGLFVTLGVLAVAGSVARIRKGDDPPGDPRGANRSKPERPADSG